MVRVESDGGRRYIYIYSNYPGSSRGRRTMTRRQTRWYRCLAHRPSPPFRSSNARIFLRPTIIPFKLPRRARWPRKTYNAPKWPSGRAKQERETEGYASRPNKKRAQRRTFRIVPSPPSPPLRFSSFFSSFFSFSMSAGSRRTELEYTYILKDEVFGRARNGFESIEGKCRVREPLRVIGSLERDCWIPRRVPGQTYIKYKAFP